MLLYFLIPAFLSLPIHPSATGTIMVKIDGISSDEGTLVIGLFDNKDDFNISPIKYFREAAQGRRSVEVVFRGIPYNFYAISVYQDLNDNGKLDKNFIGIPTEPYGFSNNPRIVTGPSFEKSLFELKKEEISMTINLH